jgi:hypothetical protein
MADEPTPWEDINPPMVSAPRPGRVSQSSDDEQTRIVFRNELTACLTLVAPVGMDEDARRDWFAVAWDTLKHLPPDVLTVGARKARLICDHPAKIVPTIMAETADIRRWRETATRHDETPPALPPPDYVTAGEAAEIMRQFGFKR